MLFLSDKRDAGRSQEEEYPGYDKHVGLHSADAFEDHASQRRRDDLRQADG